MNTPLVSILVPVYNVEKYIEKCVRSILGQTYTNLEYVFVDDGSSDSSISILNKVIDEYPDLKRKIVIIHHPQNKGIVAARNTAISACHGDYVFHVDSDDWIEPNAVEVLVEGLQDTNADIVYTTGYYKLGKELSKIYCHGWSVNKKILLTNLLQENATICLWSKLIKKSLYTDNDIISDEQGSFYEDYQALSCLIYYSQAIVCVDAFIYHYNRLNPSSFVSNLARSVDLQRQGVVSIQAVCSFFHGKERQYEEYVKIFYVCYLYKMLNVNARHGNEEGYKEFLILIKETDRNTWSQIGWDKTWRRIYDHLFFLRKVVLVIRRAKQKAVSVFFKKWQSH